MSRPRVGTRGSEPAPVRPLPIAAGLLVLGLVWIAPLPAWVPGPFSAAMTMHMGVVAVAAPLLALGWAGTSADPVRRLPALFAPVPASVVELVAVWGWHAPALHRFARGGLEGLVLEQGTFLASGLLLWLSVLGGSPTDRSTRRASGVVALLLTSMHMTLLGALLALPPRALYPHEPWTSPLTPLDDQHLGGAIMLVVGGSVYLAAGVAVTLGLLRGRAELSIPAREARP